MKHLDKLAEPGVLTTNRDAWTSEYVAARVRGENRASGHWGHGDIRQRLREETADRCAYCEGFVTDVGWANVEHIQPKSQFPEKAHAWENLTLGCEVCNGYKGDYHDPTAPLINPYQDEPTTHIRFVGSLAMPALADDAGRRTIVRLKLSRPELVLSRERRLSAIQQLLDSWARAPEQDKEALMDVICVEAGEGEFSRCVLAMLHQYGAPCSAV